MASRTPTPPPPPPLEDWRPPAPPAGTVDSDEDSDLELMAASAGSNGQVRSASRSSDEGAASPGSASAPKATPPSPSPKHSRRKSAMNIFDSEIHQSFAQLEKVINNPLPPSEVMAQSLTSPLGSMLGIDAGIGEDEDEESDDVPTPMMRNGSTSSTSSSYSRLPSQSVASFNSPSPQSRPAALSTAIPTTPSALRRGSDFRARLGSPPFLSTSLASALSPSANNNTKAKCLLTGCTAFSARNGYCLRHVWRLSIEDLEPVNQKQYQVAKEIVTTEKSYSDGLRIIYKSFVLRIQTMNEMEPSKPLIDPKELRCIFHNIEDLFKLAENLYLDLEEITLEKVLTAQIGTTLLHYAPQFRIYQTYLENYDDAIKTLGQVRKDRPEFDFFCKLQEKCEGMSLESFLIMPVQRLPRYLLLLQELLKRSESATSVSDEGVADMQAAKDKISNIASSINLSLHQKENQIKVLAIQNQFEKDSRYQDLATPTRYLVREGPLKKRYGKGSRHLSSSAVYHFFLFNDIMVYADASKNVIGRGVKYKLKHLLPLMDMTVEPISDSKGKNKDITVSTKGSLDGKSFDLSCADTADRDSWLKDIQGAIDKLADANKNLRTTSYDGTAQADKAGKSSKLKAMMGV